MLLADDGSHVALTKPEISVLTSMMANPDNRPGLAALWLHPAKAQAWATDGYRAVLAQRHPGPSSCTIDRPVAIPAITAAHAAKTAKGRDWIVVNLSGREVGIEIRSPTAHGTTIETYDQIEALTRPVHGVSCPRHREGPGPIEHLFPTPDARGRRGADVALNPVYLKSVTMLAKVIDPLAVFVNVGTPRDPVLFTAADGASMSWRVLIMPVRAESRPTVGEVAATDGASKGQGRRPSKGRRGDSAVRAAS